MKRTHGESKTRLYRVWAHMKGRCNNPNDHGYKDYGGRGIKICDEWNNSYESFREWAIHNGYQEDLTIDRVNVNGNYEPNNCRWVTNLVQARNKRETIYVTCDGVTKTLSEWAEELGVSYYTLHKRIKYLGFSPERVVKEAVTGHKYFNSVVVFNGEEHTLGEWAKILGIEYDILNHRIYELGQPIEKAFTTPVRLHCHGNEEYTFKGETLTLRGWAGKMDIPYELLRKRIYTYRWPIEKALSKGELRPHKIEYKGQRKTLREWAECLNITEGTLYDRIRVRKWPIEKALETPIRGRN